MSSISLFLVPETFTILMDHQHRRETIPLVIRCEMVGLNLFYLLSITVSMALIWGVYGTETLRLGSSCYMLIQLNPMFVQSLKIEEKDGAKQGLVLYGCYNKPALNVLKTWSKMPSTSVQADSYKEWIYHRNENSQINISCMVRPSSLSLFLIIAKGSGVIGQDISKSSNYYVALGDLNSEDVEVELNLRVRAFLYNTIDTYYKCTFTNGQCHLNILFPGGNSIVVTTPHPEKWVPTSDEWCMELSYGPRWITYAAGTGVMLLVIIFLNKFQHRHEDEMAQDGGIEPERILLLRDKDEDLTSWGSSYDSVSHDESDLENRLAAGSLDNKPLKDRENSNNSCRLCAIYFDAPRDCFFIPCGHSVACFECRRRIAEAAGTCPICCKKMKKVRKIYTI